MNCANGCGRAAGGRYRECWPCRYQRRRRGRRRWACSYCGGRGHNVRSCPERGTERFAASR